MLLDQFGKPIRSIDSNQHGQANAEKPALVAATNQSHTTDTQPQSSEERKQKPTKTGWGQNVLVGSNIILAGAAVFSIAFGILQLQLTKAALTANQKSSSDILLEMKAQTSAAQRSADAAKSAADTARMTLGEVKSGGVDTHTLAVAAGKQADASNIIARNASAQAAATNALAKASQDSAQIARQQLEASSRPWVIAALSNPGPLIFTPAGAQLRVEVITSNTGHSPAINLDIRCEFVAYSHHYYVVNRQKRLIEDYRRLAPVLGATLFPQQEAQRQPYNMQAVKEEGEDFSFTDSSVSFVAVGCVHYRFGMGTDPHHTCFAYTVDRIEENGTENSIFDRPHQNFPVRLLRLDQITTIGVPAN